MRVCGGLGWEACCWRGPGSPATLQHNTHYWLAYCCTPWPGRSAAGDQFALLEAVTALAMIVRRFDFERAPDKPAGERVCCRRRAHSPLWLHNVWLSCGGRTAGVDKLSH